MQNAEIGRGMRTGGTTPALRGHPSPEGNRTGDGGMRGLVAAFVCNVMNNPGFSEFFVCQHSGEQP